MDIIIPPPILCVHIKRFKDYGEKITSTVRVDYNIDIKKYVIFLFLYNYLYSFILQDKQNYDYYQNTKYVIFGMTIHLGHNLRSGHYYSIVRRNNIWYQCNDNKIKELKSVIDDETGYLLFDKIDKESILRNGYLFFYRKIYSV